ncbi:MULTISPECIES: hypothetical protein [unclassified Pseudonocardia]|uniref:hypothetical protein n=1 Tax=unclassified Pseudonocardia TaxID=2619320 RepID=UPI0001FFDEB2|nr:hypothetical protein [Pseudonocardia sp. Ae707_Ps1]OLM17656.1 hypothetical protein Ae707Ps1_1915c [Pseudonocardia sp. Ae707_Ps1]
MRPDTPFTEADPTDAREQRLETDPDPADAETGGAVPMSTSEADPADVAEQQRDAGRDGDDYF